MRVLQASAPPASELPAASPCRTFPSETCSACILPTTSSSFSTTHPPSFSSLRVEPQENPCGDSEEPPPGPPFVGAAILRTMR